ncbi:MAG TPA: endolytic transglycosylase MltG [Thermodesulforhabdus norvegica]|uniref:Endolytic murein transglycosylase n=1 Tax=Thermodesulforhabdus norvegica TaxID=39841 RepID=A0A7C0WUY9_9BACT|nr:endolytic transglycosylase MltG [Thermodesulforhabdus norvegica]
MKSRWIGITVILISFFLGWLWISFQTLVDAPLSKSLKEPVIFEVMPGEALPSIVASLKENRLLDYPVWFRLLARLEDKSHKLKAGEYLLTPEMTPRKLLDLLVSGKAHQRSLTLVEGWDFKQLIEAINTSELLRHSLTGLSKEAIMERLGFQGIEPEGRFLSDTYHFPKGTRDIAFLKRAWLSMEKVLDEEWKNREANLPFKTAYEALILASIVEKETGRADERPIIAGVFVRRLIKGMRLQTDPTVIYGMGEKYDGNIRKRDLLRDTPYNTYTRSGLTPTPIAMPGRAAINAVMHPAKGKSLYFVAKGDHSGSHVFSATLKEHNRAVDYYQKKIGRK